MIEASSTPVRERGGVRAGRGPAATRRPLTPLHVFEFRGNHFAYFIHTGDLVGLSPEAARVLAWYEEALDRRTIEARARYELGEELAQAVLHDLAVLEAGGLLHPDVTLTSAQQAEDVAGLLRHQPRNLMFFVTEACNLKCTYCYEKVQGVHASARMLRQVDAERTIDAYFAEAPRRDAQTITFFGGEPLLNPDVIRETVAYAKRRAAELGKQVDFTMTSNLTLLTEDMADFLAREGFHVMVSIDGDREGHDRYRKAADGSGTYDVVTRNLQVLISRMRAHGTRLPKIRATLTAENSDPIAAERHLRGLGTPLVMIGETHGTVAGTGAHDVNASAESRARSARPVEDAVDAALTALDADPAALPELPRSLVKALVAIHEEVTRTEPHGPARPSLCGVCRNMKAVTPTGDLFPCHRYVGMEAFKMGNLREGGLDRHKVRDYYDRLYGVYQEKCAPCWLRHLCGGQCPWYLSTADGAIQTPDDAMCDDIRDGYERRFGLYATLLSRFPAAFEALLGTTAAELRGEEAGTLAGDCKSPEPTEVRSTDDER